MQSIADNSNDLFNILIFNRIGCIFQYKREIDPYTIDLINRLLFSLDNIAQLLLDSRTFITCSTDSYQVYSYFTINGLRAVTIKANQQHTIANHTIESNLIELTNRVITKCLLPTIISRIDFPIVSSSDDLTTLQNKNTPLIEYLEKETNIRIKIENFINNMFQH